MLWNGGRKGWETDDPFTLNGSYSRGGIGHSCNNQWGNAVVPKYGEHVCIGPVVRDSRTVCANVVIRGTVCDMVF